MDEAEPWRPPPGPGSTRRWRRCGAAGIEASGYVVDRDPYTAVLDVVESDPPAEIIVSTLPRTRSGWMRRDLVERLRDRTHLPVEHVVVDEPSESTRA